MTTKVWKKNYWNDKSKFSLFLRDCRCYIGQYQCPTEKQGHGSAMVLQLFNHDGIVPQVYINAIVDGNIYKNIFENNMLSYALKSMLCGWMFQ